MPLRRRPNPVDTSHAPCLSPSPLLTMADAAEMLDGALDMMDARSSGSWLPWT